MRSAAAHPLGNFTVNHFTRIEVGRTRISVHYVVDMAEIPTFQEQQTIDTDGDGASSPAELEAYARRAAGRYADGLRLGVDGARVLLALGGQSVSLPQGEGGLPTLRVECDLYGDVAASDATRKLTFANLNHEGRTGWHEIVVEPRDGVAVFDSTAYGNSITSELKAYPGDLLTAPLNEREAVVSFSISSGVPAGAKPLVMRDGRPAEIKARDPLTELIAVPQLSAYGAFVGLLIAAGLGAGHAFSPGHGKTVVGAYLVGARGTWQHAVFLGLTVTITHTLGVFALGVVTLAASQYVVPEQLYPVLTFISGAMVAGIGLSLFVARLRAWRERPVDAVVDVSDDEAQGTRAAPPADHEHDDAVHFDGTDDEAFTRPPRSAFVHSHGGRVHSHAPPGADGTRVTWRSLLALGVSGGLLPCPSALVVLLAAISLHRVGYGLLLVVAFSLGLAATLTCIGLVFVYAGRFVKRPQTSGGLLRALPVLSALVIACLGALICLEAFRQF